MSTFDLIHNVPFTAQVEGKEPADSNVPPGTCWLPGVYRPLFAVVIPCMGMYLSL